MYASKLGGCLVGALLVDKLGRRPLLCTCFLGVAAADLVLSVLLAARLGEAHADDAPPPPPPPPLPRQLAAGATPDAALHATVAVMYALAEVCWSTLDTYFNEAFPTASRAPAIAFSSLVGRALSGLFLILGPLTLSALGAPALLRMSCGFMACGGLLALSLRETAGKPLE